MNPLTLSVLFLLLLYYTNYSALYYFRELHPRTVQRFMPMIIASLTNMKPHTIVACKVCSIYTRTKVTLGGKISIFLKDLDEYLSFSCSLPTTITFLATTKVVVYLRHLMAYLPKRRKHVQPSLSIDCWILYQGR